MQDDRPRRGKGRKGRDDRGVGPGEDSGFFANDGFEAELDPVAGFDGSAEDTALTNMDPIREAQLFEQFEQDYRSGGYDPGTNLDLEQTRERFGPDPRDDRRRDDRRDDRPRHGRSRPPEGGARIPMFTRKTGPEPARRPQPSQPSPFGELTGYVVPIAVAVVVVMVLVVLLLNR